MKKNWLVIILGVLIFSFSACSDGGDLESGVANLVPESSSAVVSFNLESIMNKANMDEVKKMEFYKDGIADVAREGGEVASKVLENPESAGIDLTQKAYFFADIADKNDGIVGFLFNVSDAKKLEDLVLDGDAEIENIKGITYLSSAEDFTIAWKGTSGFMGILLNNSTSIEEAVIDVFNNKSSISGNSKAVKALSQKGDVNYYFTTDVLTKIFKNELAMSEMFTGPNYFEDNHFWGSTTFEKGKIESVSASSLSKALKSDLKMIFADGSETDFSRYIPKENLMLSVTGKLNMRGINQLLKDKNLNGILNVRLNAYGLTADDLAKAIDGDMVLAVNSREGNPEPSVLFAIKIGDRKVLDEILGKGEVTGMINKSDKNTYEFGGYGTPEAQIIIKDKLLIFSNNLTLLAKLEKGKLDKSEAIDSKTYEAYNGVMGFYIDYGSITSLTEQMTGGSELGYSNMKEAFAKLDWGTSTSTVTMKDDSKNALESILEGVNQQYIDMKKQQEEWEKEWEKMEREEMEMNGLEYEEAVEM